MEDSPIAEPGSAPVGRGTPPSGAPRGAPPRYIQASVVITSVDVDVERPRSVDDEYQRSQLAIFGNFLDGLAATVVINGVAR